VDVRVPSLGKFDEEDVLHVGSTIRIVKNKARLVPSVADAPIVADTYPTDLATTLQYAQGFGDVELREFAREHIKVPTAIRLTRDGTFAAV
jgi:hypothetical protein